MARSPGEASALRLLLCALLVFCACVALRLFCGGSLARCPVIPPGCLACYVLFHHSTTDSLSCSMRSNFAWKDRADDKYDYQGIVVQHPSKEAAPGAALFCLLSDERLLHRAVIIVLASFSGAQGVSCVRLPPLGLPVILSMLCWWRAAADIAASRSCRTYWRDQRPDVRALCPAVGYMGPFQLKKGQEIEFTRVAKRKRMAYMK